MENIFENFTINILKLNKLVQKIKNYEMREYGLKTIHVMCGYFLKTRAEGLTASELSKLTLEDKAAISRALKTMQEKGLVSYDPNTYNSVIRLTDEGKKFADAVCEKATRAVEAGSYDFTEEERLSFYGALGTIAHNLEEYYDGLIQK
ncbi:MAG: MarR family winged helix-turn-helix transcriptional regulator [Clostridia bacterium]|nr:MarR family winged helix-turn-helix transcriptional regulator [Clostridia bacterium]